MSIREPSGADWPQVRKVVCDFCQRYADVENWGVIPSGFYEIPPLLGEDPEHFCGECLRSAIGKMLKSSQQPQTPNQSGSASVTKG